MEKTTIKQFVEKEGRDETAVRSAIKLFDIPKRGKGERTGSKGTAPDLYAVEDLQNAFAAIDDFDAVDEEEVEEEEVEEGDEGEEEESDDDDTEEVEVEDKAAA